MTEAELCRRQVIAAGALVKIVTRFWSLPAITWDLRRNGTLAGTIAGGLPPAGARAVFGAWTGALGLGHALAAGPPRRPATHRAAHGRWEGVMVGLTAHCGGRPGAGDACPAPPRRADVALGAAQALTRIVTAGEQAGAAIDWQLSPDGRLTGTVRVPGNAQRVREVFRGWEQHLGLGGYEEAAIGDEIARRAKACGAVDGVPVRLAATLWPGWPPPDGAGRSLARAPSPRQQALMPPPMPGAGPPAPGPRP